MSEDNTAGQIEEEEIFYTITPKQVYIYLLNGEVSTLNEVQSSLGYTSDDVNETIVFMCRETIRVLFPWRCEFDYAHNINDLRGMVSWIRQYYGEDYLFNAVCKYYEIAFEPEDLDLPPPLSEEDNSFGIDIENPEEVDDELNRIGNILLQQLPLPNNEIYAKFLNSLDVEKDWSAMATPAI